MNLNTSYSKIFTVRSPVTGKLITPDSGPTITCYKNGLLITTPSHWSVAANATGIYKITSDQSLYTDDFRDLDTVNVVATVTIDADSYSDVVDSFVIDQLENMVSGVDAKITTIDNEISGISSQVTVVDNEISGISSQITNLDGDVSGVHDLIDNLDIDVSGLGEVVNRLESGVTRLEDAVSGITSDVNSIENVIGTIERILDVLEADVIIDTTNGTKEYKLKGTDTSLFVKMLKDKHGKSIISDALPIAREVTSED